MNEIEKVNKYFNKKLTYEVVTRSERTFAFYWFFNGWNAKKESEDEDDVE